MSDPAEFYLKDCAFSFGYRHSFIHKQFPWTYWAFVRGYESEGAD